MVKACGASDVESRAGEALGLGLRVDRDATWAPLVLAMAEMERNCLACVPLGACWVRGVLHLQTQDLWAFNGGDALEFGASQLDRAFSQLGMAVRNENRRN